MSKSKNSSAEYTRVYEGLRGVDFSIVPSRDSHTRFSYLENMYVDYDGADTAVESVVGFRTLAQLGAKINGIFLHKIDDYDQLVIVHAGTNLYMFDSNARDSITKITPVYTAMKNTRSRAVRFKDLTYIMDGTQIMTVDLNGTLKVLGGGMPPYVPVLSQNGEEMEEINLLTDSCICKYQIESLSETGYASPTLTYEIINEYSRTCKVTGIGDDFSGELHIPSYVFIDGKKYKVTTIGATAFKGNSKITALRTNSNLEVIEKYAFRGCPALKTVHFSDTVSELGHYSFYNCTALTDLYIGIGFTSFGVHSMDGCTALKNVYYAGSDDEFIDIERVDQMAGADIHSGVYDKRLILSIPVSDKISSVDRVVLSGSELPFVFDQSTAQILIDVEDKTSISKGEAVVHARVQSSQLLPGLGATLSTRDAILKCTIGAVYDGRLFLSGNPYFPGYVFYSSIDRNGKVNPAYFSATSLFSDGDNEHRICSLLATDDALAVFKFSDSSGADIFYHKASEKGEYPVSAVIYDAGARGDSFAFLGEAVFVSDRGLCAIERSSGRMRAVCRSSNVNRLLLNETQAEIRISEWQGYLVLSVDGRMYLGDPRAAFKRDDHLEYEWYFLNGIGTYTNPRRIYRYSATAPEGFSVHENADQPANGTVYSQNVGGFSQYYVYDSEKQHKYSVYMTDEFRDGSFDKCTAILGFDNLLYFGTSSGSLCIFNNDKRGIPPEPLSRNNDYDKEKYKAIYGRKIHPDYYEFDGRPINCVASTRMDDCDLPCMRKSTLPGSLTVKFKTFPTSRADVLVSTNAIAEKSLGSLTVSEFSFSDLNFGNLSTVTAPSTSRSIPESERGWVEKKITVSSNRFRSPIGIYSIGYRYKIKGKIKEN